jgi:hypothetical protein
LINGNFPFEGITQAGADDLVGVGKLRRRCCRVLRERDERGKAGTLTQTFIKC